jgi:phage host-nuclease inhibitor protein Gam
VGMADQLKNVKSEIIELRARVKALCWAKKRESKIHQDATKSKGTDQPPSVPRKRVAGPKGSQLTGN